MDKIPRFNPVPTGHVRAETSGVAHGVAAAGGEWDTGRTTASATETESKQLDLGRFAVQGAAPELFGQPRAQLDAMTRDLAVRGVHYLTGVAN
jgi:hypothetical protein